MLNRHPEIAHDSIFTAVVCGDLQIVARMLSERPAAAAEIGGPRGWPPLLYLCSARLAKSGAWSDNAQAIAQMLLDRGADPSPYYAGGSPDIRYTALTCVAGRGEEQASVHPAARALAALLLARGAEPYDQQVLYNVFGGHASHRHLADDDFVWLLELIHRESMKRGREADWAEPEWRMLEMGGYGCGAWYLLNSALKGNGLRLAEWMLSHGASPNPPRASDQRTPAGTLYEQAIRTGLMDFAELLAHYGAPRAMPVVDPARDFAAACFAVDRERARALVAEHPDYLRDPGPLFAAAERDRVDVVTLLLDLGISPDLPNPKSGNARALHIAAYSDSPRVATLLIERGAEIDPRDDAHGTTPIYWALWGQRQHLVDLLGPFSRDVWALVPAGKIERLREVLSAEPRLALSVYNGDTPLFRLPDDEHTAAEIVRLFLSHGADPSVRRPAGTTAGQVARARGLLEAAELLKGS